MRGPVDAQGLWLGVAAYLLWGLSRERRLSVVVVTHNEELAHGCDRVLRLEGGRFAPV